MLFELLTSKYPGMRQWLMQRLSATVMAVYVVLLVIRTTWSAPNNYLDWHAFFAPLWWRLLTLLFFVFMLLHAWIGVRDVLRDYVFNLRVRAVMQVLVDAALLGNLAWICFILWDIN
jgi:succinate dehydrogenase / fumarate reductase, membrane anchor subunit